MNAIEKRYGKTVRAILVAVNPIKKKVKKTDCLVHQYLNREAIKLLKENKFEKQSKYFEHYKECLNKGVVWADQDFKSSNHFYNVREQKGLYGFSNALNEGKKYYKKALGYAKAGDEKDAIFYLGAACHLIQDTTVPQHVNNKLLKEHRTFEVWIVKRVKEHYYEFKKDTIIRYDNFDDYIKNNAIKVNKIYLKNCFIQDKNKKYMKISPLILNQARRTTAGVLMMFYDEVYEYLTTN